MSRIFISYRRDDSAGWTGRLVGYLKDKFGADSIFSDIDTIEPGADFTDAITRAVGACDVLLAVIGPRWLIDTDTNKQRRLDDPADWVRTEITAALNRKIRVIPVLVGKAGMPAERELPPEIKALAERQAHELSDKRWEYDCQRLATMLEKAVRIPARGSEGGSTRKKLLIGGLALTVIILMGIAMTFWNNLPRSSPSTPDDTLSPPQARNDLVSRPPIGEPLQQPTPKQKTGSAVAQYPINLRANQEVRLAQTNSTYKILSVELDRSNSSTLLLRFNIRLTNNSGGTTLFWNDSFRLLVEGVPRAPISSLSTTVAAHSAKDGTVEFTTPDTVSRVVLQFRYGDESAEIPIDLTSVQL
jgi:hypothetical protein